MARGTQDRVPHLLQGVEMACLISSGPQLCASVSPSENIWHTLVVEKLIPEEADDPKRVLREVLGCPSPHLGPKQRKWPVGAAGRMQVRCKAGLTGAAEYTI